MTRNELITQCNRLLISAAGCEQLQEFDHAAKHMSALLDLLLEELACKPPKKKARKEPDNGKEKSKTQTQVQKADREKL